VPAACRVVLDAEVRQKLPDLVGELLEDRGRLREMGDNARILGKPGALDDIAAVCLGLPGEPGR